MLGPKRIATGGRATVFRPAYGRRPRLGHIGMRLAAVLSLCASVAVPAQTVPAASAAHAIPSTVCVAHAPGIVNTVEDSTVYRSPSLCQLVAELAAEARHVPAALTDYRVSVESEVAFILRTAAAAQGTGSTVSSADAGRERLLQVEQIESALRWERNGTVDQHIIGYRSRAVTASPSALSVLRQPWVVPVLYGNRLQLLLGRRASRTDSSGTTHGSAAAASALLAIHPFADDRAQVYRFGGGDTVAVLRLGPRAVTVVRITVDPATAPRGRTLLFRGTIDVDAERHQIIRMRGQFVIEARQRSVIRRALNAAWETVVFAELENAEFDGIYWLPSRQRIEGQARSAFAGELRPLMRVVSRFTNYRINQSGRGEASLAGGASDTARAPAARITFAPRDSMSAFDAWQSALGTATNSTARATDFDDIAPDHWRPAGAPFLDWRADRINDVFRYNRVEGVFTGLSATLRFRDAAPGLSVGTNVGWAWAEHTPRGSVWSRWARGPWLFSGRAERSLVNTNDFRPLLDYEQSLMALLVTADDYDYVDRRSVVVGMTRTLPIRGAPAFHIEAGPAFDRGEVARVRYGLIHLDSAFRGNRAAATGGYVHTAAGIDLHPNVTGDFLAPGVGGGLWYERGDGPLSWQRLEARLTARRSIAALIVAGRLDAIALFAKQPIPQQVIEFGESEGLPGYAYKEFGGDRAVLARGAVEYQLPFLRTPIRLGGGTGRIGRLVLPGLSPSIAVGGQAGWAAARDPSTRAALALFGTRRDSVSGALVLATRPTDGIRSTLSLTLRLFGGTIGLGVARPLDSRGSTRGWNFVFGAGQAF